VIPLPDALFSPPIAHRGLWSPGDVAENSLTAFERACQAGYGLEFDVRLSSDGEAMVFHDDSLERMTGEAGSIETATAAELARLHLLGDDDRIPSLSEALRLVDGRAMLLVEIKSGPGGAAALAARTAELLARYPGPAAAISFDAEALAWLKSHRPRLARGLDAKDAQQPAGEAALERSCEAADPHFLVLELGSVLAPTAVRLRAEGRPVIAWTVRSQEDSAKVADHSDNFIFEGFTG
jgi:glycerophosphoryl diester phosphodiesterase